MQARILAAPEDRAVGVQRFSWGAISYESNRSNALGVSEEITAVCDPNISANLECHQLWHDIVRAGSNDAISVHFIGSIVYIEAGLSQVTHQAPLLVIDGQQRLTTVTLLLAALAKAVGDAEIVGGFSTRKLRNYYLLNPEESGERHFKLLLSQTDKKTLSATEPSPHFSSQAILQPQIRILIPRYSSCESCGCGFCVAIIADEGASFQKPRFRSPDLTLKGQKVPKSGHF